MGRPHRPDWEGAIHHVTAHGGDDLPLFRWDADRQDFLLQFADAVVEYEWICHAYCLMGTHYHFLLETPLANLSTGMHRLNTGYARTFNRRRGRRGHVFLRRFHSVVVTSDAHLVTLSRYIVLNTVRARIHARPEDCPWSSYRGAIGLVVPPPFLTTSWILSLFDADQSRAQKLYRAYVERGVAVTFL